MRKTWKQQFKSAFFGMVMGILVPSLAMGQATLLPNAKQQYVDDLGNPVASGKVDYFVPGTSTRKTVWLDAAQTTPSTNPVLLDAAGRPQPTGQTYGSGSYRQRVVDQNGLTIWDAVTTSTGGTTPAGGGGTPTIGDGMQVGTLLPFSGMTAPANYLFSYGQPVSRSQYTQLLAAMTISSNITCVSGNPTISGLADTSQIPIGAAVESICLTPTATVVSKTPTTLTMSTNATASQTVAAVIYPWGNGDGSTTFNVPDMRGRVPYGRTNMGGTSSLVMTQTYYGNNPNGTGATGGLQSWAITQPSLPNYSPVFHGTLATISVTSTRSDIGVGAGSANSGSGAAFSPPTAFVATTSTGPYTPAGTIDPLGSGAPIPTVSPGATVNWIIKVIPDTISVLTTTVTLPVVAGDYACFSNTNGGILDCGYSPKLTIPTDVRAYGAVCDGTTDDHVAIQSALNVTKAIMIPGNCSIGTSTITMNASGQTILGVNKGLSKLTSFATNLPNITVNASLGNLRIAHLGITKVNTPVSGGDGIHFNGYVDTSSIDDTYVTNQYVGISVADSNYGTITNNIISNTVSDALRMSNPTLSGNFQWVLFNNLAQFAGGWNYNVVTPASGFAKASMGNWAYTYGFNSVSGGIAFQGNATVPIQGVRISNTFLGNDGGPEILMDTYNTSIGPHQITNVYAETNTTGACLQITVNNNGGTAIDTPILAGCAASGINNASNNVSVTGGMALSATTYGIVNSGGMTVSGMNLNGAGTGPLNNTGTYVGRLNTPASANTAITVPEGGTGVATFTSNLPLIGNGASAIAQGTASGNTTKFVTTTGTLVSGNCAKWDASGNLIDAGGTCGGGGGGSPGGTNGQGQYNNLGAFGGYTVGGDMTAVFSTGVFTLNTVNSNVGSFGSATNCVSFTTNGKGLITAASATTCTPAIASVTGLGTGVATALAINVGTAGSFVTNGGALGTPSSGSASNLTGTTAAVDTSNTNLATNAYVLNQAASASPLASAASAAVGTSTRFARADHVHPGNVIIGNPISGGASNGVVYDTAGGNAATTATPTTGQILGESSGVPTFKDGSQVAGTATGAAATAGVIGEIWQIQCSFLATTVTISQASPAVVTWAGHSMTPNSVVNGVPTAVCPVTFTTTGALPSPLVAGTTYYAKVINSSTFNLATTVANAIAGTFINTTTAGSGTQTGSQTLQTPVASSGTALDATGMALPAGDWNITCGIGWSTFAPTPLINYYLQWVSTTSATLNNNVLESLAIYGVAANVPNNVAGGFVPVSTPTVRKLLASTTNVYCGQQAGFTGASSIVGATPAMKAERRR